MCGEKRKDDRSFKGGTLITGGPECESVEGGKQPQTDCDQPQGDSVWTLQESDLPIVRDGNADQTA